MFNKNEHYEIRIDDIGKQGEGIGRMDGFAFFVEGALPLDLVEMRIVKLKKSYGFGKLIRIIEPSPARITPKCPAASKCGGCTLQHMAYSAQLDFKTKLVKDNLERIGGFKNVPVDDIAGMDEPYRYRNKAQFPVREANGEAAVGFFSARSHNIAVVEDCCIQRAESSQIAAVLKEFMAEHGVRAYDEQSHTGVIRHLVIRSAFHTGEIMVCVVINANTLPHREALVSRLIKIGGVASVVLNINREKTNVIMGRKSETLWGKPYITDYICGIQFQISPLSFFQVNPVQTEILYKKALELANVNAGHTVIDAFCGIGTISLFFASAVKNVYGIEIVPEAVRDAVRNARENNIKNAEFIEGASEEVLPKLLENVTADLLIVDPPRKGCEPALLSSVIRSGIQKLIYISCDPATLSRDLKILCGGGYSIKSVSPVDMFPMSAHVECVVLMSREDG